MDAAYIHRERERALKRGRAKVGLRARLKQVKTGSLASALQAPAMYVGDSIPLSMSVQTTHLVPAWHHIALSKGCQPKAHVCPSPRSGCSDRVLQKDVHSSPDEPWIAI